MTEAEKNELKSIYIARNNEYIRLEKEGKSREEIDALFPERKKPEKKK